MAMPAIAAAMIVTQQNNIDFSNAPEWIIIIYAILLGLLSLSLIYFVYTTIKD